jgi:hypothetical protein
MEVDSPLLCSEAVTDLDLEPTPLLCAGTVTDPAAVLSSKYEVGNGPIGCLRRMDGFDGDGFEDTDVRFARKGSTAICAGELFLGVLGVLGA